MLSSSLCCRLLPQCLRPGFAWCRVSLTADSWDRDPASTFCPHTAWNTGACSSAWLQRPRGFPTGVLAWPLSFYFSLLTESDWYFKCFCGLYRFSVKSFSSCSSATVQSPHPPSGSTIILFSFSNMLSTRIVTCFGKSSFFWLDGTFLRLQWTPQLSKRHKS